MATKSRRPRCAVYTRLSEMTADTTSPQRQREIGELEVQKRNGIFDADVDHYTDLGKSAYQEDVERPGLRDLLTNLDKYDLVIVYRIDRLSRRVIVFNQILQDFADHDVAFASATEPFDTSTPMGRAMVQIVMVFAEMESSIIGARVANAQAYMTRNGRFPGGRRPFGWQIANSSQEGGHYLALDEIEAPLLRAAVSEVISGRPMRQVCVDWNEAGVTSALGNQWGSGTLANLLRNPVLIGQSRFGGKVVRNADGAPVENAERLIDDGTWHELQSVLDNRGRGGAGAPRTPSLLTGIARCATCHRPLIGNRMSYYCTTFNDSKIAGGKVKVASRERDCPGASMQKRYLDSYIIETLVDYWTPERVAGAVDAMRDTTPVEPIKADLDKLQRRLDRLELQDLDGDYEGRRDLYRERRQEITDAMAPLHAQLREVDPQLPELLQRPLTYERLMGAEISQARRLIMFTFESIELAKALRRGKAPVMAERVRLRLAPSLPAVPQP